MPLLPLIIAGSLCVIKALLNSRGAVVMGCIFLFGVWAVLSTVSYHKIIRRSIGIIIIIIYGIFVVSNIRWYGDDDSLIHVLNPIYSFQKQDQAIIKSQWLQRLDGLYLLQRFKEGGINEFGYAFGEAWRIPAIITLTQFILPEISREYKRVAKTTAKSYLMEKYTDLDPGDAPSCVLTDVYGNFGVVGFFFSAIFLACAFAILARMFAKGGGQRIFITLFLATHLMIFENSFIHYLLGWPKVLPILFILLIINPINYRKKISQR